MADHAQVRQASLTRESQRGDESPSSDRGSVVSDRSPEQTRVKSPSVFYGSVVSDGSPKQTLVKSPSHHSSVASHGLPKIRVKSPFDDDGVVSDGSPKIRVKSPSSHVSVASDGSPKQIRVRSSRFVTPDNTGAALVPAQDITVTKQVSAEHSPAKEVPDSTLQRQLDDALDDIKFLQAKVDRVSMEGEQAFVLAMNHANEWAARCSQAEHGRNLAFKQKDGKSPSCRSLHLADWDGRHGA